MANLAFSHGGNIYAVKRKYKREIIDFSANINPLGLNKTLKKEFVKSYKRIFHYPDPEAKDLIRQISKYWKIDEENILLGNGSTELIYLIIQTFKPRKTLIPAPTFSEYERAAKSIKSKIRFLNLEGKNAFALSMTNRDNADIFFISNPNNPTGNLLLKNQRLENLAGKLTVIDEAFMDFLPEEKKHTFIWRAIKDKRIIVLRSFTKFFALPGLRAGYLVAPRDLIERLKEVQPPWNVNSIAQFLARVMLNDKSYIKKTREFIHREKEFLFNELAKIKGLMPYPSVTNFLLLKIVNREINSSALRKRLIPRGILIRDGSDFRNLNDKYIRVAVRSHRENIKLISALKEILCKS
jgi:threonine-phosphate decarboxylase